MPTSTKPATLGQLKTEGIDIWAWCEDCSHHAVLPIRSLVERLGESFPVPRIKLVILCSQCGSRNIDAFPRWRSLGVVARHQV